ncbi:MAG TPA: hypothetical protein VFB03_02730 [Candidatus Saccharimonadales bacterium]|nr:hypothetical protein [Candidatus Saccharimonadales bacterium]
MEDQNNQQTSPSQGPATPTQQQPVGVPSAPPTDSSRLTGFHIFGLILFGLVMFQFLGNSSGRIFLPLALGVFGALGLFVFYRENKKAPGATGSHREAIAIFKILAWIGIGVVCLFIGFIILVLAALSQSGV